MINSSPLPNPRPNHNLKRATNDLLDRLETIIELSETRQEFIDNTNEMMRQVMSDNDTLHITALYHLTKEDFPSLAPGFRILLLAQYQNGAQKHINL